MPHTNLEKIRVSTRLILIEQLEASIGESHGKKLNQQTQRAHLYYRVI